MAVEKWHPFKELEAMRKEMDRLWEEFFPAPRRLRLGLPWWRPSVEGGIVTPAEEEVKEENYYYRERSYQSFARTVDLPTKVDTTKVKASYKDGILEIHLPKVEELKPKKVKIEVG